MINLDAVSKSYDKSAVLKNISFQVSSGERVSLLGPGGCGKSTILKILLGLTPPDKGTVQLMGQDMVKSREQDRQDTLRKVGMAFQQGALFDFMTVEENLIFAMEHMTDMSKIEMSQKIEKLLKTVKLSRTRFMFPHELSGGMKRRIGIARALATDPTVAIFDEPTSGLDPVTSTIILNMIQELGQHSDQGAQLISTSSVEIAIRFAERVILVHEGEVVADGPWKTLIMDASEWVKHFLSVRLIGIDIDYARELGLPDAFIQEHWQL
ncbi:MAG: ATP-binding cassette domain-containing protein [Proteobacteria bacterium]|nr:ATP-binding cassette domain-containing protein [Pseudomonadota bacterium]